MRQLITPRSQLREAINLRRTGLFRGRLAEDYDGIGQYVLVALAGSSVAGGYKARVAAGDFGSGRIFPRSTPVLVHSLHGQLEILSLGGRPTVHITPIEIVQFKGVDHSQDVIFDANTAVDKVIFAWLTKRGGVGVGPSPWSQIGSVGVWQWRPSVATSSYQVNGTAVTATVYETNIEAATFNPATDVILYEVASAGPSTSLDLGSVTDPLVEQLILYGASYNPPTDQDAAFATAGSGWTIGYNNWDTEPARRPWHLGMHWDQTTIPLVGTATVPVNSSYGGAMLQVLPLQLPH